MIPDISLSRAGGIMLKIGVQREYDQTPPRRGGLPVKMGLRVSYSLAYSAIQYTRKGEMGMGFEDLTPLEGTL